MRSWFARHYGACEEEAEDRAHRRKTSRDNGDGGFDHCPEKTGGEGPSRVRGVKV